MVLVGDGCGWGREGNCRLMALRRIGGGACRGLPLQQAQLLARCSGQPQQPVRRRQHNHSMPSRPSRPLRTSTSASSTVKLLAGVWWHASHAARRSPPSAALRSRECSMGVSPGAARPTTLPLLGLDSGCSRRRSDAGSRCAASAGNGSRSRCAHAQCPRTMEHSCCATSAAATALFRCLQGSPIPCRSPALVSWRLGPWR